MCIRDRCYVPEVYYTQSHRQRLARVVPGEGGRVLVVALDVVHDLLDELLLGGPHAASHHLPRKDVEEDLHLVQPGGVGGRPTYASWLNQVEIFFNIFTREVMRGGVWTSKKELVEQIMYYIKSYNEDAAPFAWNYTGKPLTV